MTALHTIACAECRRMMVRAEGEHSYPLCAVCLTSPGWFNDPTIAWVFACQADAPKRKRLRSERKPLNPIAIVAALIWIGVIGFTIAQIF